MTIPHSQNSPHWLQACWRVPKEQADFFTAQLAACGLLGSEENLDLDPAVEAAKTHSEILTFFADTENLELWRTRLSELAVNGIQMLGLERIPQGDWATAWKKYFKPFNLTKSIVIRPSWEEYSAQKGELVVTLDPGMAFGTGQHDTTRFCAELISVVATELRHKTTKSASFLDIGCGSGILSIIAAKLGFAPVLGIDNDAIAIETSLENRERNPTRHNIPESASKNPEFLLTSGGLDDLPHAPFDVIVANIFAETVCELKKAMLQQLKPEGRLILSGVIRDADALIRQNFADMKLEHYRTSSEWHAYVYRR